MLPARVLHDVEHSQLRPPCRLTCHLPTRYAHSSQPHPGGSLSGAQKHGTAQSCGALSESLLLSESLSEAELEEPLDASDGSQSS